MSENVKGSPHRLAVQVDRKRVSLPEQVFTLAPARVSGGIGHNSAVFAQQQFVQQGMEQSSLAETLEANKRLADTVRAHEEKLATLKSALEAVCFELAAATKLIEKLTAPSQPVPDPIHRALRFSK